MPGNSPIGFVAIVFLFVFLFASRNALSARACLSRGVLSPSSIGLLEEPRDLDPKSPQFYRLNSQGARWWFGASRLVVEWAVCLRCTAV